MVDILIEKNIVFRDYLVAYICYFRFNKQGHFLAFYRTLVCLPLVIQEYQNRCRQRSRIHKKHLGASQDKHVKWTQFI